MAPDVIPRAGRLAGIVLLVTGAACAGRNATQSYLREVDPKSAYSAYPSDGSAAAKAFTAELKTNPQFIISRHDAGSAAASLLHRPLNARLLSFLALRDQFVGKIGQANAIMASADKVSRRDPLSQLWMIEQKSVAGDVRGAVSHYNALLSVHSAMQATLIPVLVSAMSYPEVRASLRSYLKPEANWSRPFLDAASQRSEVGQYLDLVGPVASRLGGDGYAISNARIIYRMLQSGLGEDAWKLFSRLEPDVDLAAFRTFAPGRANLEPKWKSLSWALGQSDNISANVVGNGTIDVTVAPAARGLIASRDVPVIPSSTYVLGHRLRYELGSPRASLRWRVYCVVQSEPQLIKDRFVPVSAASKLVQLSVEVPEKCNIARFELSALGPEGQSISTIKINDLSLEKTH